MSLEHPSSSAEPRNDLSGSSRSETGRDDDSLAGADVLHVITGEDWGGAPRIVELLATRTRANAAVACAPNPRLRRRLEAEDVPVHVQPHLRAPPSPLADTRSLVDLLGLVRRESFDLVHCHSTKSGVLGRVAASLADVPTVFTVHGWGFYNTEYDYLAPVLTRVENALERVTDEIVCVSENDLERGRERGIVDGTDTRVIRNGIPHPEIPSDRSRLSATAVDTARPVIGSVGRLVEQKRPTELFRAGRDLQRRGHDPATVWIGAGHLGGRCERFLADATVDGHLLGFRQDALELAVDFDVFVVPSKFEGFPISVLEAMYLGVPVVAYDVGGVSEAVVDGETGFVVPDGDREALVDRIERLVEEPVLAEQMGRRARTRAREQYSSETMVERYEETYLDVLDRAEG